jgi:hypothetical protein
MARPPGWWIVNFFESLFRLVADWVETWPGWLQWVVLLVGTTLMVGHFLLWITWLWFGDDSEDSDVVVPFRRDGGS